MKNLHILKGIKIDYNFIPLLLQVLKISEYALQRIKFNG